LNQAKLEQTCEGDKRPPSTIECFVQSWSIATALETRLVMQTNDQKFQLSKTMFVLQGCFRMLDSKTL